jgi:hypothetical protein
MAADPVTAIGNALAEALGTVRPIIGQALREKHEVAHKNRLREWADITSVVKPDPNRVHSFVMRLITECGQTTGGRLGDNISVPVGILNALIEIASENAMQDKLLANIQFKE